MYSGSLLSGWASVLRTPMYCQRAALIHPIPIAGSISVSIYDVQLMASIADFSRLVLLLLPLIMFGFLVSVGIVKIG